MTRERADGTEVVFRAPGAAPGAGVPLVSELRTVELSDHPVLSALRGQTSAVAQEALRLARALADVLPKTVADAPRPCLPSLWQCYEHEFARYSLAPVLMNLAIARRALREAAPNSARLVAAYGPPWWLGGSGAAEAVAEAAREADCDLRGPQLPWRTRLRRALLPQLARRAARRLPLCLDCARLPTENLSSDRCEVLFLGVAATTAPLISLLSSLLESRGVTCAAVDFHYESSTAGLRRSGVRVVDIRPLLEQAASTVRRLRRSLMRQWPECRPRLQRLAEEGIFPRWLLPVAEARLIVALGRDLPALAAYREAASCLLEALRPRLVAGFHLSPDFLAPFVLGAHARGAATACIQHGIRGPVHRSGVVLPWQHLVAWGKNTVDLYAGLTEPGARWTIAGSPLYDSLRREGLPEAGPVRKRLGLGAARVVLAATQTDEAQVKRQQARWWLRGVAEACRSLGARLLVKMHPAETDTAAYHELSADFPETVRLCPASDLGLREALAVAEVLVTRDSTVVYAAALANRPVITVNLPPYLPRFALAQEGGALGVCRYEDIRPALEDALAGGPLTAELARRRAGFLEYHLGPADDRAGERTVQVLLEAMATAAREASKERAAP